MNRICPNCSITLSNHEYFFCTTCGNALPEEYILRDTSFKVTRTNFTPVATAVNLDIKKLDLKRYLKPVSIGFGLLLLFLSPFLANNYLSYQRALSRLNLRPTSGDNVQPLYNSVTVPLELGSGPLADEEILSYLPEEVDLYIEVYGFKDLVFFQNTLNNYSFIEDVENRVAVVLGYLDSEDALGIVLRIKDSVFSEDELKDQLSENFEYYIKDGYLVLSNNSAFLEDSRESSSGIQKHLGLSSKFKEKRNVLSETGGMLYVNLGSESQSVRDIINYYGIDSQIIELYESILKEEKDNLVVNNAR